MNRSLWAVLLGTFTLRFSTGLTGAMLIYYLAELHRHHRLLDELLGLGPGQPVGPIAFGVITALFYAAELVFSPVFGVLSDRIGHHRVMQFGPVFGALAAVATWVTTNLPIIGATRILEGSATASSVPSILGYIAAATADDEGLRGKAVARFEAATLAGLLSGFVVAGLLFPLLGPTAFLVNGLIYGVSFRDLPLRRGRATRSGTGGRAGGGPARGGHGRPRRSARTWATTGVLTARMSGSWPRRGSRSTPCSASTRPRRSSSWSARVIRGFLAAAHGRIRQRPGQHRPGGGRRADLRAASSIGATASSRSGGRRSSSTGWAAAP